MTEATGHSLKEKAILQILQEDMPLVRQPFKVLAEKINLSEHDFLEAVKELKSKRLIRRISPIYDTKMVGYDSSLVAFKVKPADLIMAAEFINSHPGVSHNYERTEDFNLWFTLAVPPDSKYGLDKTVELFAQKIKPAAFAILRSEQVFKIGVKLNMDGSGAQKEEVKKEKPTYQPLTDHEKEIIRVTQYDMPLVSHPFADNARELRMPEDALLEKLQEFKARGIIRRTAAILYHRRAGFSANGMSVWKVPPERVEEVGYKMASYKAVSHCYERTTSANWPYNIFGMIHATSKEEVEHILTQIREETGLEESLLLYSLQEFKKSRVKYFTSDFYEWEKNNFSE